MGHGKHIELPDERFVFTGRIKAIIGGAFLLGVVLVIIGLLGGNGSHAPEPHGDGHAMASLSASEPGHEAPAAHEGEGEHHHKSPLARLWANLLINGWFFFLIAAAGTFFVAVKSVSLAGWYTVLKRIPEAMGMFIPIGLIALLAATWLGFHDIYHWGEAGITDPASPNYDEIIAGKSSFLNTKWLYFGTAIVALIWFAFHMILRRISHSEDEKADLSFYYKTIRYSAGFIVFYAFSLSALTWVNVMSVDPHWFSTIFSVYNFATGWVSAITIVALILIFLRSQGYMSFTSSEHLHDLGKMMFAFSIFWTYLWLSQYLLIWYANMPEETIYYVQRIQTDFKGQFMFNVVINFAMPFLLLMTRDNKRNSFWLVLVGVLLLFGHWNDVYLMIMPAVLGDQAAVGAMEIGMFIAFASLFAFVALQALTKGNIFPKNHPYLQESLQYDTGP